MNEHETKAPRTDYSEQDLRERKRRAALRRRRMRVRRQKRILVLSAIILFVIIMLITGLKSCSADNKLTGLWKLDDMTAYQFDNDGTGAMVLTNRKYDFTFKIKGDQLCIDYESEMLVDGNYTYLIKGDTLTLTEADSSNASTYELHKQDE